VFCPRCGHKNEDTAARCAACSAPMPADPPAPHAFTPPPDHDPEAALVGILPVKTSFWALAAGYLGLLSPLVVFAPFAVIAGVVAIFDLRRHPGQRGYVRAAVGIVLGGAFLLFVVAAMISASMNP